MLSPQVQPSQLWPSQFELYQLVAATGRAAARPYQVSSVQSASRKPIRLQIRSCARQQTRSTTVRADRRPEHRSAAQRRGCRARSTRRGPGWPRQPARCSAANASTMPRPTASTSATATGRAVSIEHVLQPVRGGGRLVATGSRQPRRTRRRSTSTCRCPAGRSRRCPSGNSVVDRAADRAQRHECAHRVPHVRLRHAQRRRAARGEVRQHVVAEPDGPDVVGGADGDHVRVVAGLRDRARTGAAVARRHDHRDAGLPGPLDREVQRVDPPGLGRVRAEREVEHADVVLVLERHRPLDAGEHVADVGGTVARSRP